MAYSLTSGPARDRFWSRACRARHPGLAGVSEPSQVRILLRPPEMTRPPCHSSVTSMVSDSGSETGAASSAHMRPAAVRCGQRDRAQCSDQHIHSSSGTLFECLRGSGRRGRRFKSGHPDQFRGRFLSLRDRLFYGRASQVRHRAASTTRSPSRGHPVSSGHTAGSRHSPRARAAPQPADADRSYVPVSAAHCTPASWRHGHRGDHGEEEAAGRDPRRDDLRAHS